MTKMPAPVAVHCAATAPPLCCWLVFMPTMATAVELVVAGT